MFKIFKIIYIFLRVFMSFLIRIPSVLSITVIQIFFKKNCSNKILNISRDAVSIDMN